MTGAPGLNVWVADQLILQIEVAVKFAPPDGRGASAGRPAEGAAEDVHRFLRQARCAARIGDPHLLQILEQGRVRGVPFLVTQLLEGRSLSQRLLAGPLSSFEVQAVLEQVAGVLAKAHPLGLFHGSLCPEHLFLTETAGQLFLEIANFGDVVSNDGWGGDSSSALAPDAPSREQAYLSPEQILQGTGSSAAADLWALGVLAYELLTTTLPFEAPTAEGVRVAICNGRFAPPSHYRGDLPSAIDAWFARVFARDPGARWLDARLLASEFAQALGMARAEAAGAIASYPDEDGAAPRELDSDFETEERTVRWEAPSEWAPPDPLASQPPPTERSPAPSPSFPPPLPSSAPPLAPPARSVAPRFPSAGPPPLPDRPPSSRPPPVAGYAPLSLPPPPRISSALLMESARATAAPRAPSSGLAHFFQINRTRGLVAGALLGAGAAFLAWGYQTWPENEGSAHDGATSADARGAPAEITAEARLRSSAVGGASTSAAPASGSGRPARSTARSGLRPAAEELPVILQTDDLPRAPDDGFEEDEAGEDESGSVARNPGMAGAHAAGNHHGGSSARIAKPDPRAATAKLSKPSAQTSEDARREPAARAVKATATPRRETAAHNAKHNTASADCNPPYYFDNNNIRRLKLECL
ncbi:MAG TPA: serine/threonine-protein kinase [Polyangiaceae bacterium]|nr:serine/threonine-protein kinase [Polyangiaceae bacterium]